MGRPRKTIEQRCDNYLIAQVKRNASSEAFSEICRRYQDLFYKVCQKYASSLSSCGIFVSDIFNEKDIIILHCVKTFDPSKKTKLSSWIGNYARYLCLNSMNSRRLLVPCADAELQKQIEDKQAQDEYFQNNQSPDLAKAKTQIFEMLDGEDPRIKRIFELRYSDTKLIWQNIAQIMDTSPQTVMSLHKKGLAIIRDKLMAHGTRHDFIEQYQYS